jgi:hypothetical protein
VIGLFAVLAVAAGAGCGWAWWRGYEQGYRAAFAQRKIAAEVKASALPVDDTVDSDAA